MNLKCNIISQSACREIRDINKTPSEPFQQAVEQKVVSQRASFQIFVINNLNLYNMVLSSNILTKS
jgi:hypothetical protein